MMHLVKGTWNIQCDDCDEVIDTEKADKEEAIQMAMNSGWYILKDGDYCENCAEDHHDEE